MYDLCIIGGGASGMSCAITAARLGLKVILIEKNNKLGKKLYATGNGRCNITNSYINIQECYNSYNKSYIEFLNNSIGEMAKNNILDFVRSLGISTIDINGYIYPRSSQASSFVWAMIDEIKKYNIEIVLNEEVCFIEYKTSCFKIKSLNKEITASQVVLAAGGKTYKNLGGTDLGYKLGRQVGHTINRPRPALCGVKTDIDVTEISGVRANATATLKNAADNILATQRGELQITSNGLSGIMIFNLSSKLGALLMDEDAYITIDFISDISKDIFKEMCIISESRTIIGLLNGLINDKLASFICKHLNIDGKTRVSSLDDKLLDKLFCCMKEFRFKITGLMDYESAQVCAGGIEISEIDPRTFMSKILDNFYVTGEVLDIDGICGGYNITFAILSGISAGRGAYDKTESNQSTN